MWKDLRKSVHPRRSSICPGLLAAAIALVAPASVSAGIVYAQGSLNPPLQSINFPDDVVPSVPWASMLNATGGAVGEIDATGRFLRFNGYGGRTSTAPALYLHTSHGTAFIEPVASPGDIGTHPPMFTLAISAPMGYGFTGLDFQLDYFNNGNPGTVTFDAYDVYGNPIGVDAGSNIFAIKPSGQDPYSASVTEALIGTLVIQTSDSVPLADAKQLDLKGLTAVPEPSAATSAAIAMVVGLGYGLWRRRGLGVKEGAGGPCPFVVHRRPTPVG